MANHRADGRALVRKHRLVGGTHRDAALPSGVVKVGVLGALATATIAAPLAAAAAGVDETGGAPEAATAARVTAPEQSTSPVALPVAETAGEVEARTDEAASRDQERTAPEDAEAQDEQSDDTGIEVEVPEPEPEPEPKAAAASGGEATAGSNGYIEPVDGPITSGFGGRMHPVLGYFKGHNGVDFGVGCGTPVQAAKSGTVVSAGYQGASGNRVDIDHGNGVVTGYYHLQGYATSVGATVEAGEVIGSVGSTGRSTGCHLHFAKMDEAGNYSNPMSLLR